MNLATPASLSALVLSLAIALPVAHACWDGHAASFNQTTLQGYDTEWRPETARELALWLPRLDALVGEEGMEIYWNTADFEGGTVEFPGSRYDLLFARVARKLGADRDERRAAMAHGVEPLTVQVGATRDQASAEAMAERLMRADPGNMSGDYAAPHGFYEAGGFPADNPSIHVVEGTDANGPVFRVVVGAFLDSASADAAVDSMRQAHGLRPFVRRL